MKIISRHTIFLDLNFFFMQYFSHAYFMIKVQNFLLLKLIKCYVKTEKAKTKTKFFVIK